MRSSCKTPTHTCSSKMAHETFYLFLRPPLKLYQHFIAVRARAFALQVRGILRWFLSEERKSPLLSYEVFFMLSLGVEPLFFLPPRKISSHFWHSHDRKRCTVGATVPTIFTNTRFL